MVLDFNGQPINKAFNFSRNKDKAIYALRGILHGIVADNKLNEMEVMFLEMWMKSHDGLPMEGDALDLADLIGDILEDGFISGEELNDLKSLISCVIEYGVPSSKGIENSINELIGLLLGISADGKLMEREITHLNHWLNDNIHLKDVWPANILIDRIALIRADGVIDEDEKREFLKVIKQFSGQQFEDTGSTDEAVIDVFSELIEKFDHLDKRMCFSGDFYLGGRNICEDKAKQCGAIISSRVTKKLDVLVVGTGASRDWRFGNYGRKIEKAIDYRSKGQDLLILSEKHWVKFID